MVQNLGIQTAYGDYHYATTNDFVYEIDYFNTCLDQGLIESPIMSAERTLNCTHRVDQLYREWGLI
ncbi:hypothetical protein [Eremococcus coleocola]|uniref:Uncharacterized protein n=1 Tax=Eremococcus coleocola ACS-139-V-Col8 TaxID=908337 RepID=E4KPX8_9LACT|nr:hypothetical protein [Eremococcus coleocola]EFR31387.1 hypothetical protein HMPREF9257_1617 [Eremococcus coleocola ACS-139-V-Col8]